MFIRNRSREPQGHDCSMKSTIRNLITASLVCGTASLMTTTAWAADASAGKAVYAAKCKSCHGADGTPSAGMAKAMGIKPMGDPSIQAKSDDDLKASIGKGMGKMKPQPVSGADMDNVVAAIRTMK
jgi:mono/diheme cytochrome c family protein